MPGTALEVLNPVTGETIDLYTHPAVDIAAMHVALGEARGQLVDLQAQLSDELIRRMDKDASHTMHLGAFDVSAPSPTAGTERYAPDMLREALQMLIDDEVISETAATAALRQRLTITIDLPFAVEANTAKANLEGIMLTVGEHAIPVKSVAADVEPQAAGIKRLRQIPGVPDALDAVVVHVPQDRKVKIKPC